MSEFGSLNTELAFIYDPEVNNAALRRLPRELQDVLGWWTLDTANAGGGVFGGFAVTEGAALRSDVSRGAALTYVSGAALPLSKWGLAYSPSTLQATHVAHEGNPRYDLLSLSFTTATDTGQTQGRVGNVSTTVNTQRGCQPTLVLTKGTASGSPSVPSTPSGNVPLWAVLVPATSGALTYYDRRAYLPGPTNRGSDAPIAVQGTNGDTFVDLMLVRNRAFLSGQISYESALRWDWGNDWPHITRSGSLGAGEVATELYPCLIPGGRSWRSNIPVGAASLPAEYNAGSASVVSFKNLGPYLEIKRVSSGTAQANVGIPIPIDGRGLKLLSAKLVAKRETAFNGTTITFKSDLILMHADGTSTTIGTIDLTAAGGSITPISYGSFVPTVIAEDDALYMTVSLDTSLNSAGEMRLYLASVEVEEGHE